MRFRWIALVLLLLVAAGAWTGIRLVLAKRHLETARTQLQQIKSELLSNKVDEATAQLAQAGHETKAARSLTHDPVAWTFAHVPFLGRPVTVARGLAEGADQITRDVLPAALATSKVVDKGQLRRPDGSIDIAAIQRLEPGITHAADLGQGVRRKVDALPGGLLPTVTKARDEFRAQVDELTTTLSGAADAVRLTPAFFGADGTKRWFVLVMQTAESRGSGGIPGGFAVLKADHGRLKVEASGSNKDLKPAPYPIPKDIPTDYRARYELDGAFDLWPNVTLSPDFPVVAKVVAGKWRAQGGQPVDGVVAVDAVALAKLLKGSPPLDVGGRSVTSDQLVDYLAVGQYRDNPTNAARKDRLAEVASEVLGRITNGQGSTRDLISGVSAALRSGHVRFSSAEQPFAPVLATTGLDGALPTGASPVAYPVINNASAGKLDHFLARQIRYDAGSCHGKWRDTTITVTLTSHAPAVASLPPYVTIRSDGEGPPHSSTGKVLLDVYGTRGAALLSATLNGQAVSTVAGRTQIELQQSTEDGLPVWRVPVETPPGQPQVFVLHLSEPTAKGKVRIPLQPQDEELVREVRAQVCT